MDSNKFEFQRLNLRYRASQEDLAQSRARHAADIASYEQELAHLRRELQESNGGSSGGSRK